MDQRQIKIVNVFQALSRKRQKEILDNVCSNMIDNQDWDSIASLLLEQLGSADAMTVVANDRHIPKL